MADLREVIAFFGARCVYCGGPYENLDHGIPLARGGRHLLSNLYPSCEMCNKRKGTKTIGEFGRLPVIRLSATLAAGVTE